MCNIKDDTIKHVPLFHEYFTDSPIFYYISLIRVLESYIHHGKTMSHVKGYFVVVVAQQLTLN